MPNLDDLITTAQTAKRLRRDVRTIHRWVRIGRLTPAAQVPGCRGDMLFRPADVERLASDLRREDEAAS